MLRRILALLAALVVPIAFAACSSGSSSSTADLANATTIEVSLTDSGCAPRSITTPAGSTKFHVTNDGTAAVTEFEVLQGGRILGEVENVIPGADRSFTLTLAAGSYATKCPGGSNNEGGTIQVAAPAG